MVSHFYFNLAARFIWIIYFLKFLICCSFSLYRLFEQLHQKFLWALLEWVLNIQNRLNPITLRLFLPIMIRFFTASYFIWFGFESSLISVLLPTIIFGTFPKSPAFNSGYHWKLVELKYFIRNIVKWRWIHNRENNEEYVGLAIG